VGVILQAFFLLDEGVAHDLPGFFCLHVFEKRGTRFPVFRNCEPCGSLIGQRTMFVVAGFLPWEGNICPHSWASGGGRGARFPRCKGTTLSERWNV